jgi:hypothetical protein
MTVKECFSLCRGNNAIHSVAKNADYTQTVKINHLAKSGLIAPILQEKHNKECCCRADHGSHADLALQEHIQCTRIADSTWATPTQTSPNLGPTGK